MNQSKNFLSLLIAFVLALAVAVLVYVIQKRGDLLALNRDKASMVDVLVARVDLIPGDTYDETKFDWVKWPRKSFNEEYFTKEDGKSKEKLEGRVVLYKVVKGEPLKKVDLVPVDSKNVLTALIRPGMKAISVPFKSIANPNILYAPGDYVDIILPKRVGRDDIQGQLVLEGVKVIAVDGTFYDEGKTAIGDNLPRAITLEVDPSQAVELAASIREGHIVISHYSAMTPPKGGVKKKIIHQEKKEIVVSRGGQGRS